MPRTIEADETAYTPEELAKTLLGFAGLIIVSPLLFGSLAYGLAMQLHGKYQANRF